ncbi:MAG TPA: RNA polymerase sigma-I factor [Mobilitalea sp.]|nr:RNA polymerase sigma-I factor [Mobilitalea sp.]
MRELDTLVMDAKTNPTILEDLIRQCEIIILKNASRTTGRYITKSDDEWSIALLAFTQAVESYELTKGSFISFAELVIKRRLIDYNRSQVKYNLEVSIDPILFDTEPEDKDDSTAIRMAVAEQVSKADNGDLKLEIATANSTFSEYGFTFFDLSSCSPQAKKTKTACAKAINFLLHNSLLQTELRASKQLPIKIIENNTKVPRKILERHRKYIIAATEILSGEYPYLADYLQYIREEDGA